MWTYRGQQRPPFADTPGPGQESVWDYPRPPRLAPDARRVRVHAGAAHVADSVRAVRVLETASPPTFYLPPQDVDLERLRPAPGSSHCEWKGRAVYWSVRDDAGRWLEAVGWSYPEPRSAFAAIAGWLSFYPGRLHCEVAGEGVRPQPGGFYGGWLTDEIVGPVKGEPDSGHW
ncbi:DUF427 domain-containing protein [Dyella sp.]|jgi:uncharacterized protein (DUF427 family)|uniref:DUF427 domain-containing protein n=1 Tax=Dyella sp. TaxID=1869338 RepID=UPI002D76C64C|nr:DUF427 domain-containing protein [Dyella sp.]HET6431322.1 DUF427 domain-containing protein [Dyella sp.]